jgi:hypothetical protein
MCISKPLNYSNEVAEKYWSLQGEYNDSMLMQNHGEKEM